MKEEMRLLALVFSSALLSWSVSRSWAAGNLLDPSFGTDGKVITAFGSLRDVALAVAVETNGQIVVAGYTETAAGFDFALARYLPDGQLDASFHGDGKITTDFGNDDFGSALAILADGRIIVAGGSAGNLAMVRYLSNGDLDTAFGTGGKVFTNLLEGTALAIQADGKIVVAGRSADDFALARFFSDGKLDTTFGTNGMVTTDFGGRSDYAQSVAIQTNGQIVVAGYSGVVPKFDFALARYHSNGELDASFGTNGKVLTDVGDNDYGKGLAIQADGKIVVAGRADPAGQTDCHVGLLRYNSDGSLDTSFGSNGIVTSDAACGAAVVAIQTNGSFVVGAGIAGVNRGDFALLRFTSTGSLDSTSGLVTTDFGGVGDSLEALAIQPDGKIVAAGQKGTSPFASSFALARYTDSNIASFPFVEVFEVGCFHQPGWSTLSKGTTISSWDSSSHPDLGFGIRMGSTTPDTYELNELVLTINLAGRSDVVLSFWHKEFNDEDQSMPSSFVGSHNSDGVAVSADGVNWHRVQGLTSADGISADWKRFSVDLDAAVAAAGISYNDQFKIKFQQYGNQPVPNNGFGFDNFTVNAGTDLWAWSGAIDLGGHWRWMIWFDYFNVFASPWIYHAKFGWLYPFGSATDSIVFWDHRMQMFWWTSETVFPYMYRFDDNSWLWYQRWTASPSEFLNLRTSQWESY